MITYLTIGLVIGALATCIGHLSHRRFELDYGRTALMVLLWPIAVLDFILYMWRN